MQDELLEILSKLADYKATRETSQSILSVPDLIALDQEIERLERRQCELMGGAARVGDKPRSRSNRMSAEIDNAKRELGDSATPANIMRELQTYAGQQGSCITRVAYDGVFWRTPAGNEKKLTQKALDKRLSRRTQKTQKGR